MNRKFLLVLVVAVLAEVAAVEAIIYFQQSQLGCFDICGCGACAPQGKEALNIDSFLLNSPTNASLVLRNVGSLTVSLESYSVKDSSGNQWQSSRWRNATTPGPTISPNTSAPTIITIGQGCGGCSYSGTPGAFTQFSTGKIYTIIDVSARNNQFTFTITV